MASTLITYSAQKLHIQCLRGSHFKLVINVKNADGSNYDFTEIDNSVTPTPTTETAHELRMRIFEAAPGQAYDGQQPLGNSPENVAWQDGEAVNPIWITDRLNTTVEDGKLTLEWDSPDTAPFAPWPGRYKYHIYTRSVNGVTDGTFDGSPIKTIWLFGDFIVKDNNMYAGEPQVGLSETQG